MMPPRLVMKCLQSNCSAQWTNKYCLNEPELRQNCVYRRLTTGMWQWRKLWCEPLYRLPASLAKYAFWMDFLTKTWMIIWNIYNKFTVPLISTNDVVITISAAIAADMDPVMARSPPLSRSLQQISQHFLFVVQTAPHGTLWKLHQLSSKLVLSYTQSCHFISSYVTNINKGWEKPMTEQSDWFKCGIRISAHMTSRSDSGPENSVSLV